MRVLLDTHALLWWLSDDPRLGQRSRKAIAAAESDILVSAASLWEIVLKLRIGKLEADFGAIERAIVRDGFRRLPIAPAHLTTLASLPRHHRDPFDGLLIAQALSEDAVLMSDNRTMARYRVRLLRCGDT